MQEIGDVAVHAEGAGVVQLLLAVAAGEHADAEHAGPPGTHVVPDGVADDDAILGALAQYLLARQEEVRLGLAAQVPLAFHDDGVGADPDGVQGGVDERVVAGGGDGVGGGGGAEGAEHLDGARQRPWARQELPEDLLVAPVDRLGLLGGQLAAGLALGVADDQLAAGADVPVQAVAVHDDADLGQGELPGQHVAVDRIDERAVQVENECVHRAFLRRLRAGIRPPGS